MTVEACSKHSDGKLERGTIADCEALHSLLATVSGMFAEWGGTLKSTFSASALSVVKASVAIPSHKGIQDINSLCRLAFHGGRVEVFDHAPKEWLREYDFTSSYPWAMTQSLPWEFIGKEEGLSTVKQSLSICYASVDVPPQWIPPLPYSPVGGGLFFPTGKWSAWFTQAELEYAADNCGCSVKVHHSIRYTSARPFAAYVAKLFADKAQASGARRSFDKLCLNGSFGKLAQKPESSLLRVFNDSAEGRKFAKANSGHCKVISPNDYTAITEEKMQWPAHTHYAAASFITAYSRILLHKAFVQAKSLAYGDTDSIHCVRTPALERGNGEELGGLKIELDDYQARFYAPKLYVLMPRNGKPFYASKGFPVSPEDFEALVAGKAVGRRRILAAKSQLRELRQKKGVPTMLEPEENMKQWNGYSAKRRALPIGQTAPWSVQEILEGKHSEQKSPLAAL